MNKKGIFLGSSNKLEIPNIFSNNTELPSIQYLKDISNGKIKLHTWSCNSKKSRNKIKNMNLKEYQILAERTCPDLGSIEKNILHMKVGILTEIGELADIFKKKLAYGKPLDYVHISEEASDICWYQVNLDRMLGFEYLEKDELTLISMSPMDDTEILDILINYQEYAYDPLTIAYNIVRSFEQLDFYKGLENNINKLKVRFPEKFTTEAALNRDLESERKELEK